ncbi:unnamed protein product [Soboliphyme baturini]|uniref:Ovule protein n=1 Tax=Soboliphyme baturini TaxID=241478 RepID=A0A183IFR0_9BILA|nr:unnamed protein product [Soboliphyme baturini]
MDEEYCGLKKMKGKKIHLNAKKVKRGQSWKKEKNDAIEWLEIGNTDLGYQILNYEEIFSAVTNTETPADHGDAEDFDNEEFGDCCGSHHLLVSSVRQSGRSTHLAERSRHPSLNARFITSVGQRLPWRRHRRRMDFSRHYYVPSFISPHNYRMQRSVIGGMTRQLLQITAGKRRVLQSSSSQRSTIFLFCLVLSSEDVQESTFKCREIGTSHNLERTRLTSPHESGATIK